MQKGTLINRESNMDFLCFGGNDWWYHNRDHLDIQMIRQFKKYGTALFVNSIVMQKPKISQGRNLIHKVARKAGSIFRGLKKSGEGFWIYSPLSLPVHHIAWLRPLNTAVLQAQVWLVARTLRIRNPVLWVACPAACDVALNLKKRKLVYQRTDRFEAYPNVDINAISQYDRKLKANADLVIFVNRNLYEQESTQCKKAICLDHGVDYEMFATAEDSEAQPSDVKGLKRPIVGYFGGIDSHSSDIPFAQTVVDLLPQMSFVFIGKASANVAGLRERENVWLLGQKPYKQIPDYGKCFDVAIMPLRQNRWIEACNPIKLNEYLALGKPVVSTPFPELEKYRDVVYVAGMPEEFAACIKKALAEDSPKRAAQRRSKVQAATWTNKAKVVLEELFDNEEGFSG